MPIFGALGLGLTIIVLQSLVPRIFTGIEATILSLLHGVQVSVNTAAELAAVAESLTR